MKTPIYDFLNGYLKQDMVRLHMPGHKGRGELGVEAFDLTEIDGADCLYDGNGIIYQSQQNATALFESAKTLYSTSGSSTTIKAMLYLIKQKAKRENKEFLILAGRNVHKSFVYGASLLGAEVEWLYGEGESAYSCVFTVSALEKKLDQMPVKPIALYITSPDYLGNIAPVSEISKAVKKRDIMLIVDNAHGSYLKFLEPSQHPIDLGADMCCDSAHKTLPVLTGGAYLHIASSALPDFIVEAESALKIFSSSSPSYLILASLDKANKYIFENRRAFLECAKSTKSLKNRLIGLGFEQISSEPFKITINARSKSLSGKTLYFELKKRGVVCEFYDDDFVVLMFSTALTQSDFNRVFTAFSEISVGNEGRQAKTIKACHKKAMSMWQAFNMAKELVKVDDAEGRVFADASFSCPPAVPVIVCGEIVSKQAICQMKELGIYECWVVKK